MSVEAILGFLSLHTYSPLLGWTPNEAPRQVEEHLSLLRREAPFILFFGNLAGCLGLQVLSILRFGRPLSRVSPQKLEPWFVRLGTGAHYPLRLVLMVLKSHALLAAYRAPVPALSPALFQRRPPWTKSPSI